MAGDAELRRRSWLRVLVPPLVFVLVVAAAVGVRLATDDSGFAALVLTGGVGLIALWAVIDGARRLFGHRTYLGTGHGIDRLAAVLQVLTSIGVALALLPNAVALLNAITRLF